MRLVVESVVVHKGLIAVAGGGAGGGGRGGFHEFLKGVGEGGGLVRGVVMRLETDLASVRPGALDSGVVDEGAEEGVIGRCEIFINGELRADAVCCEVVGSGKG